MTRYTSKSRLSRVEKDRKESGSREVRRSIRCRWPGMEGNREDPGSEVCAVVERRTEKGEGQQGAEREREVAGRRQGERKRRKEGMGALPSMPLLGHVKYANCDYVEARASVNASAEMVLPSTNHVSFGPACIARAMGTSHSARVLALSQNRSHGRHTRAPTFFSRIRTRPPPFPPCRLFFALVATSSRSRATRYYAPGTRDDSGGALTVLGARIFSSDTAANISREFSRRKPRELNRPVVYCPENPSRPISRNASPIRPDTGSRRVENFLASRERIIIRSSEDHRRAWT